MDIGTYIFRILFDAGIRSQCDYRLIFCPGSRAKASRFEFQFKGCFTMRGNRKSRTDKPVNIFLLLRNLQASVTFDIKWFNELFVVAGGIMSYHFITH